MDKATVDFAKALALLDKLMLEMNPNLSRDDKECLKQLVDYCQKQIELENHLQPKI